MYNPLGEKLLTSLRLIFSHLKEPKLRHGFADTMNPMCARQTEVETTEHFLLQCHFCSTQRSELLDNTKKANSYFKNSTDKDQVSHMLYGSKTNSLKKFGQNIIKIVIKACICYSHQIFIFSPNDSPSKNSKMLFISSKKLFSFSRQFFVFLSFPFFLPVGDCFRG